jgi:hypothetical protein
MGVELGPYSKYWFAGYHEGWEQGRKDFTVPIRKTIMTREEALDWLFKHLHPVIRANGCKRYKEHGNDSLEGCKLCSEQQRELKEVKETFIVPKFEHTA